MKFTKSPASVIYFFLLFSSPSYSSAEEANRIVASNFVARFDCLYKKNASRNTDCLSISKLSLKISTQTSLISGFITLDPYGAADFSKIDLPERTHLPTNLEYSKLSLIDEYGIRASAGDFGIQFGSFTGNTNFESLSGLGFEKFLNPPQWKQTALNFSYTSQIISAHLTSGLGEGENAENLDPQSYLGADLQSSIADLWHFKLGYSIDGNNAGSRETFYFYPEAKSRNKFKGLSVEKLMAQTFIQSKKGLLAGLKFGFGFERDTLKSLNDIPGLDFPYRPNRYTDPAEIMSVSSGLPFPEKITRDYKTVGISYRIMDVGFVGLHWSTRQLSASRTKLFITCATTQDCENSGEEFNSIKQTSSGAGFGWTFIDYLTVSTEIAKITSDRLYQLHHYQDIQGKHLNKDQTFINLRISYAR